MLTSKRRTSRGFTIVELLIVIVVIAILAAITIVSYNGIQQSTKVSVAQSELSNIAKKLELYKVKNSQYPTISDNTSWKEILVSAAGDISDNSKKSYVVCASTTGEYYAVAAWVPVVPSTGGDVYYVSSNSSSISKAPYAGMTHGSVGSSVCYLATGLSSGTAWSYHL